MLYFNAQYLYDNAAEMVRTVHVWLSMNDLFTRDKRQQHGSDAYYWLPIHLEYKASNVKYAVLAIMIRNHGAYLALHVSYLDRTCESHAPVERRLNAIILCE